MSVTVDVHAQKLVAVPFLAGKIRLATGPVSLARLTGAPLLPVFTVRAGDGFETTVLAPLQIEQDSADEVAPLIEYARILEEWVRQAPEQWLGWVAFMPERALAPGAERR